MSHTFEKIYILDTNIILEDANQMITVGQDGSNLIVLPETVIDELDSKKSGFSEINYQAREFGRILSEAEVIKTTHVDSMTNNITIMSMVTQGIYIDIISSSEYDLKNVDKSVLNDRKIISIAEFATKHYENNENTILLSNDIMCRTRAISLNVKAQGMTQNKGSLENEFVKYIDNFNSDHYFVMEGKHISEYDPDWSVENYCYHFKGYDGNEKIAYIVNERIYFIDDDKFNGMAVMPLNMGQKFAMAGMVDDRIDVCVIEALAGSGKTLLAIAAGMKLVKQGDYDKIIYIRNSVESVDKAEEVGFLPGLEEKFRIYNYPLFDTLEFIAQKDTKIGGQRKKDADNHQDSIDTKVEYLVKKFNIETMWNGSIRGRTISNAFVIIDEVQNFSKSSLQTVLSRMDKDSKVVCIGSNRQIDHPYINKYTNGLSILMKAAKTDNPEVTMYGTVLNKVVRGKITQWAERIFEKK